MGRSMKVIIAGGRDFKDFTEVVAAAQTWEYRHNVELEVVCGEARGADTLGRKWAEKEGRVVHSFPADWAKHGRAAGPIRNAEMADFAKGLIAFWDGKSRGTGGMIKLAKAKGLIVEVIGYNGS